jgi:hypothetical protein
VADEVHQTLELPLARIGCDLKIFNFLVESKAPLTVAQLAEKTKADPGLLGEPFPLKKAGMTISCLIQSRSSSSSHGGLFHDRRSRKRHIRREQGLRDPGRS